MANYNKAFEVVMSHEDDSKVRGKITRNEDGRYTKDFSTIPVDQQHTAVKLNNGQWYYNFTRTRFGVDERSHPELRNSGFYSTMPTNPAFDVARGVFHKYWMFDAIVDQIIATKIMDACVNAGQGNALPVVQQALSHCGQSLLNWHWGPAMIAAINACVPGDLIEALSAAMIDYYHSVAKRKGLTVTPGGWITRAQWEGPVPTT